MRIGAMEETVVVSGASPIVDVQNVMQRHVVGSDLISTLPTARSEFTMALLVPGMIIAGVSRPSGQDVGGSSAVAPHKLAIHGGKQGDSVEMLEGIPNNTMNGWSTSGVQMDAGALQEISFEMGAMSAESSTGGVRTNWIPKDGGNRFTGSLFGTYVSDKFQADDLSDDLIARGLTSVNQMDRTWDSNESVGGPFKRDKLWFYFSQRNWGSYERVAGMYFDLNPTDYVFTPDLNHRAIDDFWQVSETLRLTWQATPKNKIAAFANQLNRCRCHNGVRANVSPEASTKSRHAAHLLQQVSWTSPLTSRVLLEVGVQNYHFDQTTEPVAGITDDLLSVLEQSTNVSFRAASNYGRHNDFSHNERASLSYVTGSHAFKFGFTNQHGARHQARMRPVREGSATPPTIVSPAC